MHNKNWNKAATGVTVKMAAMVLITALASCSAPVMAPVPSAAFYDNSISVPTQPGVLIKSEALPQALGLDQAGQQLRVLYSSTDGGSGHGTVLTSGAVFYPQGAAPAGGWPVMAWAHGTVGVGNVCTPSNSPRSQRDAAYLNAWLQQGFAVVATDYQGLGVGGEHLYVHPRAEAYAVLDSVRAALSGLPHLRNQVILLGQSQGASAVFATAGFAPSYAPELHVLGTVATGTPYLSRQNPSPFKPDQVNPTLAYVLYLGRTAQALDPTLRSEDMFSAKALPVFAQVDKLCVGPMEKAVVDAGLTNANTLTPTFLPRLLRLLGSSYRYPTLNLAQPLFMGTGGSDVDVSTDQQIALAHDACKAGSLVQQHIYPGLTHSATVNASLADSVPFVRKLLAGATVDSTCNP